MRLLPKTLGGFEWPDIEPVPPGEFVAGLMELPLMTSAEGHGELIAYPRGAGARRNSLYRGGWRLWRAATAEAALARRTKCANPTVLRNALSWTKEAWPMPACAADLHRRSLVLGSRNVSSQKLQNRPFVPRGIEAEGARERLRPSGP